MRNRAFQTIPGGLGFAILGLLVILVVLAGGNAWAAGPAKVSCTDCHDQGAKLAKSAHAGLTCDTCHESHDQYPHPANIPKPVCGNCHTDQAGDYSLGVHGQARAHGNEGAPDCVLCHGSAHELLSPRSQAFRAAVPDTCGMCHSEVVDQYRASVHGQALAQGRDGGSAVHRLPWRAQHHQAHQRGFSGQCAAHSRYLRELPRQRTPGPPFRPAHGPDGQLRFLLPRSGRPGGCADCGQLRQLSRRA